MKRLIMAVPYLFLLINVTPASAERQWIKATSGNFELYTTAGEKKARDGILYFEQVRSFFIRATGLRPSAGARVRIVAFSSEKEYRPYAHSEGAAAYAGGGRERDEIVLRNISWDDYPIAVHEFVHILLKPLGNKLPLWINEGMADLFSTLKPVGKKVQFGHLIPGRLQFLREQKWLDLETLTAVDHDSPYYNEKDKRGIFYAESWALMHMLLLTDPIRKNFPAFFDKIQNGIPQEEAFRSTYGKPMYEIWMDLQKYMRGQEFNVGFYDVKLEKTEEEAEIRPCDAVEYRLVLANLLTETKKLEAAKAAYADLVREFPDRPEVFEGRGYANWVMQDTPAALADFDKAVALGSKNAKLHTDYAGLLESTGGKADKAIPVLEAALKLDPELTDARLRLGFLYMNQQKWEAALAQFARIRRIQPDKAFQFFHGLAFASHQAGKAEEAKKAAARAKELAKTPTEKADIQRFLSYLEQLEERKARLAAAPAAVAEPAAAESDSGDAESRRTLERRVPAGGRATVIVPPQRPSVEGILRQVECMLKGARVHVLVAGKPVKLLIDDPAKVAVLGAPGGKVDFACGVLQKKPVRIEYDDKIDGALGTIGIVRLMEFK